MVVYSGSFKGADARVRAAGTCNVGLKSLILRGSSGCLNHARAVRRKGKREPTHLPGDVRLERELHGVIDDEGAALFHSSVPAVSRPRARARSVKSPTSWILISGGPSFEGMILYFWRTIAITVNICNGATFISLLLFEVSTRKVPVAENETKKTNLNVGELPPQTRPLADGEGTVEALLGVPVPSTPESVARGAKYSPLPHTCPHRWRGQSIARG